MTNHLFPWQEATENNGENNSLKWANEILLGEPGLKKRNKKCFHVKAPKREEI